MLRARCQACQETIYIDTETGHKFSQNDSSYPHECSIKIPRYTDHDHKGPFGKGGVMVPYSEQKIASMITEAAIKAGWNPYEVRAERRGDFLILYRK